MPYKNLQAGLSLPELMVVLVIMGILMAIAMPDFLTIIRNGRLATEANDLMTDLAFARAEATRRGQRVTLCVSSNGTSCGTGSSWGGGRLAFADAGTAGTVETGDEVLRYHQATSSHSITVTASGFGTLNFIQYKPSGAMSTTTSGQFKICDGRAGNFGRIIAISTTGRVALYSTTSACP